MESESLLRGNVMKTTLSKVIVVVFVIVVLSVVTLSITAIVLSAQAVNESGDGATKGNDACNFAASSTPNTQQASKQRAYEEVSTLIQNATVWTGTGVTLEFYDILIEDGLITKIERNIIPSPNTTVYNVNGAFVTPGLVDMHSHIGVYALPEDSHGTDDGNEMTDPTRPEVQARDAFDPNDKAIPLILSGGVTTSLVLPGSGNVMGGQGFMVKMKTTGTVSSMVIEGAPTVLKMAAGENPKRVYGGKDQLPMTRMGSIWTMRSIFSDARSLRQRQDQWDCLARGGKQADARPYDAKLVPLLDLLRGDAVLMVHAYTVQDFEAILRVADEFGIKISAFHHALEAWKIPTTFAERNITLATFADSWGFKLEAYDGSVHAPSVLHAAGASVALKSDHPVIFAKYLLWEASRAYHYGLDGEYALRAVTSVPAKAMGWDDHIGTLEEGKDGDVVVWDRHPLALGAVPQQVFIEGILYVNNTLSDVERSTEIPQISGSVLKDGSNACSQGNVDTYTITDATVWTMTEGKDSTPINGASIVVVDGLVNCVGQCTPQGSVFSVSGGVVIPGIVSTSSEVGLMEVEQEENTQDGYYQSDNGALVRAVDGLRFQTRHIYAAWRGGVTVQVAAPQGSGLVAGVSAAFYTSPYYTLADDALLSDSVALHINVGNSAKQSAMTSSVSGQFSELRYMFSTNWGSENPITKVLAGDLPVVFHVDQADEIVSVLRLKREFNLTRVIVSGGAEAGIAAAHLSLNDVGVILSPLRAPPHLFELLRASPDNALELSQANVTVGIAMDDAAIVRNLRWEAGYGVEYGLSYAEALAAVTSTVSNLLGLPKGTGTIEIGTRANFVLYNEDPLSIVSKISLVALGTHIQCNPIQR